MRSSRDLASEVLAGTAHLLGPELVALVEDVGAPLVAVRAVTTLPSPIESHASYRLAFADGRVLKGRRVETSDQADRMERYVPLVDPRHFPRVLARRGRALLEPWVPGRPLEGASAPLALCRRAGALLGALHRVPLPVGATDGGTSRAAGRLLLLERQAAELAARGVLAEPLAARAVELARAHLPRAVETGLIHRDFCAENMVVDIDHPWVVDNESLCIHALDFDLARTWYRWPMAAVQADAFREGYEEHRSTAAYRASFPFWALAVLVNTSLFRLKARTPRAWVPLRRLQALLRDPEPPRAWRGA